MKQRYDTAANWTAQNPTLLAGEIGIESDTKKWKVGTGATAWTSLVYAIGGTYPIVNADVAAAAGIVDTKLATIATAGKVSNSATTAASANTASAIVARDASGNFTAGTITAALTGAASSNVLKAGDTMTGALAVTAGTAALPGIAVSGDPNTGIYSPGADQVAISTNGTSRIVVDASGKVGIGIGTTTPSTTLEVNGTVTATAFSGAVSLTDVASTGTNLTIDNATPQRTIASISLTSGVWLVTGTWSGGVASGLGTASTAQQFGLNTAASFGAVNYNNDSIVSPGNTYVCAQSSLCFIATVASTETWYLYGGPASISSSLVCVLSGTIRAVKMS